jgi:hypothetical protein
VTWNLRIGRRWPGETAEQASERLGSEEQEEVAPDPAEIRRIGDVLATAAPAFARNDAPKGWTLTHGGSGAQIRMSGDEFSMTVPRAFSPSVARSVWTELWPVVRVLADEGYCVYAPPLGRIIDPASDLEAVVGKYAGVRTPPADAPSLAPPKPWWRFW